MGSIIVAIFAFFIGKRRTLVKKRLASVDERRQTLKALYLYTNPEHLARIVDAETYIEKLIEIQSSLEYCIHCIINSKRYRVIEREIIGYKWEHLTMREMICLSLSI